MQGRNWRERDAQRKYETWSEWLTLMEDTLPRSRYAQHAVPGGWALSGDQADINSMSMMMSMMSGSVAGAAAAVAGMPADEARHYVENLSAPGLLAQYFLTSAESSDIPQIGRLEEILQHPMYQLK